MGIPFYFASLLKSHRSITRPVKQRMDVDVLGVDFNCLIHRYLQDADPVKSVVDAFEHIVQEFCRPKHLLIAMDGIVPYAKIVQQRYRRMRTQDAHGEFDRNQISPGTPYMKELESALRARFPYAVISGTLEEGEGEHKLFNMLRALPPQATVCIYGLDADLILICLQHMGASAMSLLRESGEFNDPKLTTAEFATLSVNALAAQLPLPVPQYIALSILCFGNDFMPALGMFSLREDGYARALELHERAGSPDLLTFEGRDAFLQLAGREEYAVLKERIGLRRRPDEKALLGDAFERQYALHLLDGPDKLEPVTDAFWKTFHWTLTYFQTNTPLSWDWVYPYPEAPLISTLLKHDETQCKSGQRTFSVTQQLQFILPRASLRTAKKLARFPDEPYTATRNPWMKRHDWECDPRISLPWHPTLNLTEIARL